MRLASKNSVVAADNRHVICRTNSVSLSNFTDKRREATRAPAFRGENFERDFDSNTLFYDAVQVSKSAIALFAPPFFNSLFLFRLEGVRKKFQHGAQFF